MSIFYQPPQPFTGGRQPSDQNRLTPILESVDRRLHAQSPNHVIEQWWVPASGLDPASFVFEGGRQPFEGRRIAPSIETASLIGIRRPLNQLIEQAWLPANIDPAYFHFDGGRQPFEPHKLCPVITAVPPVIRRPENQVAAQQQEWPQPVNDPSYYNFFGGRQPFDGARLPPSISAVPVNSPNATRDALTAILEQWWPQSTLNLEYFVFFGGNAPFYPRPSASANIAVPANPPPGISTSSTFASILAAWTPGDPTPTLVRHIFPVTQVQPSPPTSNWQDRLVLVSSDVWQDPYTPPQLGVKLGHTGSGSLSVDPPPKMYSVEPFAGAPFTLYRHPPHLQSAVSAEVDLPPSGIVLEPYAVPGLYQNELGPWILIPTPRGAAIYATSAPPPSGIPYSQPPVFQQDPEWTLIPQSTRFDQRGGASNQPPPPPAPELTISFLGLPREIWDPSTPLPELPTFAQHPLFGPPPPTPWVPSPNWLSIVLNAWQPPDPPPTLPTKFAWQTPSFADVFVTTWESVVLSWWTPLDPPSTLPKQNSPGIPGQSLDPPKPNADALINQAEILAAWTPGDPAPQLGIRTSPPIKLVPFYLAYTIAPLEIILSAWTPPDPAPTLPRNLPAAIKASAVNVPIPGNQPTFGLESILSINWAPIDSPPQRGPLTPIPTAFIQHQIPLLPHIETILQGWTTPDPLPTTFRGNWLTGISVDAPPREPPRADAVLPAWAPLDPPPILLPSPLPELSVGSKVDYPPPQSYRATETIIAAWQPPDPLPVLKPFYLGIGLSVDQPPIGGYWPQDPSLLAEILAAWQPPDPAPTLPAARFTGIPGWSVNTPRPRLLGADPILTAWRDPDPLPIRENLFVWKPAVTQSVDNPPVRRRGDEAILPAWQPPDPLPTLPTARFTGIPGWSVDTLPGFHPFVVTWPPDPPMPWVPFYLVQRAPFFAPKGTSPWMSAIVTAWQPPDPQPTLSGKLAPSLITVPVNQPPSTQVQTAQLMATISAAWIPPDPPPTRGIFQAIANVGTQHYFRRRMQGQRDRVEITGQRPFVDSTASGTE